jgi:hypothetical protein
MIALSNMIKGLLIAYGLIAIALAITWTAQPLTGGADEIFSRLYSITMWPSMIGQISTALEAMQAAQ